MVARDRRIRSFRRTASLFLSPFTGEEGRGSVVAGLSLLVAVGSGIGAAVPKNPSLPTLWYRWISSCVGYTYFLCWSVSFYPQVVTNYKRKTTDGLSLDFCALNVIGFGCYAAYNLALFYSSVVQQQYRERHGHGSVVTVQSNDVAFAVHAFVLSSLTLLQIGYYDGFRSRPPSKLIGAVIGAVVGMILVTPILVYRNVLAVLDFLYLLSYIKIGITLIKYVPQVILNFQRKCTRGWSTWSVIRFVFRHVLRLRHMSYINPFFDRRWSVRRYRHLANSFGLLGWRSERRAARPRLSGHRRLDWDHW
jgi:cystinosin